MLPSISLIIPGCPKTNMDIENSLLNPEGIIHGGITKVVGEKPIHVKRYVEHGCVLFPNRSIYNECNGASNEDAPVYRRSMYQCIEYIEDRWL